jgi:GDP-L-fucose synthase
LQQRLWLTGANGMLGRNILETAPDGWEVLTPARSELDLADVSAVADFVRRERPTHVIHAAGKVGGIHANIAAPADFLAENLRIGLNVLEAADQPGTRILNVASSCIYPPEAPNPLREDMLLTGGLEPTNEGYALAKLAVLRFGQYRNRMSGEARIKSVIPCNLYGAHDKFGPAASHLVPAIIAKICDAQDRGEDQVEIWGDGSARREFLLAEDCARMIWSCLGRFDELPELMNLGLGADHSVLEYYEAVARVAGWHGRFRFDLDRPVGMKRKLVDDSGQRALGIVPQHSLEQGLAKTLHHYRTESAK